MEPITLSYLKTAAQTASDKLGDDIVALDVRPLTSITEYFLFVGAKSYVHVGALEDSIRKSLAAAGAKLLRTDGQRGHSWRVLDFGALIIHVMDAPAREFYAIERLWNLGKKVEWETRPTAKAAIPAPSKKKAPKPKAKTKVKSKPKPKSKPKSKTKPKKKTHDSVHAKKARKRKNR